MPFKEINVKKIIDDNCKNDAEFKTAWDACQMEYAIIGQLTAIRKQQQLSQKNLASKMESSQQALSRIENMSISPSLKTVCSIAESLGYEIKLVPKS